MSGLLRLINANADPTVLIAWTHLNKCPWWCGHLYFDRSPHMSAVLAKLQNSDSTPVVIDSLEGASVAGKPYLQLYSEEEDWGREERIHKSCKV